MADEINLQVNVDKGDAEGNLDSLSNKMDGFAQKNEKLFESFTKMGTVITGFAVAGAAAIYSFASAAGEAQANAAMLENAVFNLAGGGRDEVAALQEVAAQLMANGVLDDDAIVRGQAQLVALGLQTDSVLALSQTMADLAVDQYGVNAGSAELEATALMLNKAMQGNTMMLEKQYGAFTETEKAIFEFGTETEKVAALQGILAGKMKYTNDVAINTMEGAMANLQNQFGGFQESIGDALIPVLIQLAGILSSVAEWLNNLDPSTVEIIAKVLLFGTALAAVVGPMLLLVGMIPTLVTGFTILTGPVGAVIAAIVALTVVIGIAIFYWEDIKAAVMDFLTNIYEKAPATFNLIYSIITFVMEGIWANIKGKLELIWTIVVFIFEALVAYFTFVWDVISTIFDFALMLIESLVTGNFDTLNEYIMTIWEGIKQFFTDIWTAIKLVFTLELEFIKNLWTITWNAIKDFFSGIWESMKQMAVAAFDFWIATINFYLEPFKAAFQLLWDGATGVVMAGVDVVTSTIKGMINYIISAVNTAIGGLNSVASTASKITGITIPTLPDIPMLAEGGIVTGPTTAIIGEAGPEAVIPLSKMGNFGGGEIHFHFEGPVSSKEVAMEYADYITKELMLNGKVV